MELKELERYYAPKQDREKNLWENCTFVFDTSALLELYYFSEKSQKNIFESTFKKIEGRLWIPNHVKFEYLKNRENTLQKPIDEKYKKLENEQMKYIEKNMHDIKNKISDFINYTKKADTHPHLDNSVSSNFKAAYQAFEEEFINFKEKVHKEFELRENEIKSLATKDTVFEAINHYFKTGNEYNFLELMEIAKEGEFRYKNQIPPGYEDGPQKKGIQKYGDLIIWKQIIQFAKLQGKPIVFITNDVKEDWCYHYKKDSEKRIDRPKEDLIKEIYDSAQVDFWMYTFSQFLYKAKEVLAININQEVIEEAKTSDNINSGSTIRFDGYYMTSDHESGFRSYYRFFQNELVQTLMDNEEKWLTGSYKIFENRIKMRFRNSKTIIRLNGTIDEEVIELIWENDVDSGSESGYFCPDVSPDSF